MDDEKKVEILLGVIEQDRKHVLLYTTFCFAVPVLSIGKLDFTEMHLYARISLSLSLVFFVLGGFSFFKYAQAIHWHRLSAIRETLDDFNKTKEIIMGGRAGVWATSSKYWYWGKSLLLIAFFIYAIFFDSDLYARIVPNTHRKELIGIGLPITEEPSRTTQHISTCTIIFAG